MNKVLYDSLGQQYRTYILPGTEITRREAGERLVAFANIELAEGRATDRHEALEIAMVEHPDLARLYVALEGEPRPAVGPGLLPPLSRGPEVEGPRNVITVMPTPGFEGVKADYQKRYPEVAGVIGETTTGRELFAVVLEAFLRRNPTWSAKQAFDELLREPGLRGAYGRS